MRDGDPWEEMSDTYGCGKCAEPGVSFTPHYRHICEIIVWLDARVGGLANASMKRWKSMEFGMTMGDESRSPEAGSMEVLTPDIIKTSIVPRGEGGDGEV